MGFMDESLAITLLRHGLTEENERHAYIGWSDFSLSEKGRKQLSHYGIFPTSFDEYVCSDLKRCVETAQLLFPNQSFHKCPAFREMHFGKWEGKTYEELKNDGLYQRWLQDFQSVQPPTGESFQQFTERIDSGWNQFICKLSLNGGNKAVIVSHGGVIRYLLSKFSPIKSDYWDWKVPIGTGFELIWKHGRGKGRCTSLREVILTGNPNG